MSKKRFFGPSALSLAMVALCSVLLALGQFAQAGTLPVTAGLVLHLDAAAIDPNGSEVVAGEVAQWNDLSPKLNHMSRNAGFRPLYVADGGANFNNRPIVRFDGVNDSLETTSFDGLANRPGATIFTVMSTLNATGANQVAMVGHNSPGNNAATFPRIQKFTTAGGHRWLTGNDVNAFQPGISTNIVANTTYLYSSRFDGTQPLADRLTMSIDGISEVMGNLNGSTAATTGPTGRMVLGRWKDACCTFNGEFAEVLIYDRALSDIEHQQVGSYLADQWGLNTAFPPVIPEPTTFALAALGLLGLLGFARRRRK